MAEYVFGELPGNPVGTPYTNRVEAKDAGIHQVTQQGIAGNRDVGAVSIVVNGGYEDDEDYGDQIIYTGAGGNDPRTKRQIADQEITQIGNAALVVSEEAGLPVRVVRGALGDPGYSPASGFRYDGLFRVERHWSETGRSGFRIWRFRLDQLSADEAAEYAAVPAKPNGSARPKRTAGVIQRVVRTTKVSAYVKELYGHACQICGLVLSLPVGNYAEGAHIHALGLPHQGPDEVTNVLCLCPNHHVLLDKGAIFLDDSLVVHDHTGTTIGALTIHPDHNLSPTAVRQHRSRFGFIREP